MEITTKSSSNVKPDPVLSVFTACPTENGYLVTTTNSAYEHITILFYLLNFPFFVKRLAAIIVEIEI